MKLNSLFRTNPYLRGPDVSFLHVRIVETSTDAEIGESVEAYIHWIQKMSNY